MIEIRAYGAAFAQLVAAENAPVLLIPAICGSLYPRATARRLSPIIEYVVTRAIVRRLIGTLHHDADSVGAKSTHGQLPMGLLAREVDARAQLMRSGAQREQLAGVEHLIEVALSTLAWPRGRELDEAHATTSLGRAPDMRNGEPGHFRPAPREDRLAQAEPIGRLYLQN
jgi:hypothetical protein